MQKLVLKHLLAIRWFHWINFPILFLMIWSGLLIYWANDIYQFGPIHFFPAWFYKVLNVPQRLGEGMAIHLVVMWIFTINGIFYVGYTLASGEWRYLMPRSLSAFPDAWHVLLFDLGLRKQMPPQEKYNAAQQITYTAIVLMGGLSLLTGFAIYKPAQLSWLTFLLGGYEMARFLHFCLTAAYLAFFVIHVAQVARAGWNNFRSMVMGFELVKENE